MICKLRFPILGWASAAILRAQRVSFKAHVPFAFVAAGQRLDAGEYGIECGVMPGQLAVKAGRMKEPVVVNCMPLSAGARPEHSALVFRRYGDQFFLSEVWAPGTASGSQIPPCHRERELARLAPREHAAVPASR